jgi:hypothetical protein
MDSFRKWIRKPMGTINYTFLKFVKEYVLNKLTFGNSGILINRWGNKPEMSIFSCPRFNDIRIIPMTINGSIILKGGVNGYCLVSDDVKTKDIKIFDESAMGLSYYHTFLPRTVNGWMGIPTYYASLNSMAISSVINLYTFAYFNNSASPDLLITVTGKKLSPSAKTELENKIKDNSGAENAHQTVILDTADPEAKVTVTKIDNEFKECYANQKKSSTEYAILSLGLSMQTAGFIGAGGLSSGTEGIASFKKDLELTGMPIQVEIEDEFNMFFEELWGFNPKMKLRGATISNDKDIAVVLSILEKMKAINYMEARGLVKDGGLLGNFPQFLSDSDKNGVPDTIQNDTDVMVRDDGVVRGVKDHNNHHDINRMDSEFAE